MEKQHPEGYALMWYGCECGHRERIWNSRDGVTPFGLRCPSCGSLTLRHVDWGQDVFAPTHVLTPGQRFFRDGTADDAIKFIELRIRKFAEAGEPIPTEVAESLRADARLQRGEWQRGWPAVDRQPVAGGA